MSHIVIASVLGLTSIEANALRNRDMSGDDAGAVAVYKFDETTGDIAYDSSGVGQALNLQLSSDGNLPTEDGTPIRMNALYKNGAIVLNPKPNGAPANPDQGYQSAQKHRTFFVSAPATKLNSCTNGITIQAFVRPWFPFQGNDSGNVIAALSNSSGAAKVAATNFGLYQTGNSGAESALVKARQMDGTETSQASVAGSFTSVRETESPGMYTEVIATREPSGVLTVYVNRIPRSSLVAPSSAFAPNARLVVGNELVPLNVVQRDGMPATNVGEQRNWSGEIAHLAIYCKGFTRAEVLGTLESSKAKTEVVRPTSASITPVKQEARKLIERLSGSLIPIDHPMIARVEEKLLRNDRLGAAKIVTGDATSGEPGHPDFLNTVVKQMAMKMSNREETIRAPFNDFAAAFIGITRDERSAKELLTGDFFYMADPKKAVVRSNVFRDMVVSNNHYEDLEKEHWDLGKVLIRVPGDSAPVGSPAGQMIALDASGTLAPNPDPAGIITSRAFMGAHAIAGTNRRLVEHSFREFMCMPIAEFADTSASPARIGRDIDRLPGGDAVKFETSCKGCHTVMDGFRGAFARFDFQNLTFNGANYGVIRNTQINTSGSFRFNDKDANTNAVVKKMVHNETVFPNGFEITDESFVNNAVGIKNKEVFGWAGRFARGGQGVNQFGHMIADSQRFSECMAKRVYESICTPGMSSEARISPLVKSLATKFQDGGYKLRSLFQEAAANPGCAAMNGR